MMVRVGVTGADGFIGSYTCERLEQLGLHAVRLVRRPEGPGKERRVVGDLVSGVDLAKSLRGVDALIHLAGRAHVLSETESDPIAAFRRVNVVGTESLAKAALAAGVRRFVFVSSIGVNGDRTEDRGFSESDVPRPTEPYAVSKLEAEQLLRNEYASRFELVIVRPPLVYGPGAVGNFRRLVRLAASGLPLPLGAIRNARSLIGVENLADFLCLCVTHPKAAGELFLISEPERHSTPELIRALAAALGRRSRMFSVPVALLASLAAVIGKSRELEKLCSSLVIDSSKAGDVLDWKPRRTFSEQIADVALAYRREYVGH